MDSVKTFRAERPLTFTAGVFLLGLVVALTPFFAIGLQFTAIAIALLHFGGWLARHRRPEQVGDVSWRPGYGSAHSGQPKVVLVTGGAMGIGRQMALQFANEGCVICIWDIDITKGQQVRQEIEALQGRCTVQHVDVRDDAAVAEAAAVALKEHGHVDVLVLNAGIVNGKLLMDENFTMERFDKLFAVNVRHLYTTSRAFLPSMIEKKERNSRIVVIGSVAGFTGTAYLSDYNASKGAANLFAESLICELRAYPHVDATLVCPYAINTGMFAGLQPLRFFAFLREEDVGAAVVGAVRFNKQYVVVPWIFQGLAFAKSVLPVFAIEWVDALLGASTAMANFTGRQQKA